MSNPEFCFGMTSIWLFFRGLLIIVMMYFLAISNSEFRFGMTYLVAFVTVTK